MEDEEFCYERNAVTINLTEIQMSTRALEINIARSYSELAQKLS